MACGPNTGSNSGGRRTEQNDGCVVADVLVELNDAGTGRSQNYACLLWIVGPRDNDTIGDTHQLNDCAVFFKNSFKGPSPFLSNQPVFAAWYVGELKLTSRVCQSHRNVVQILAVVLTTPNRIVAVPTDWGACVVVAQTNCHIRSSRSKFANDAGNRIEFVVLSDHRRLIIRELNITLKKDPRRNMFQLRIEWSLNSQLVKTLNP